TWAMDGQAHGCATFLLVSRLLYPTRSKPAFQNQTRTQTVDAALAKFFTAGFLLSILLQQLTARLEAAQSLIPQFTRQSKTAAQALRKFFRARRHLGFTAIHIQWQSNHQHLRSPLADQLLKLNP